MQRNKIHDNALLKSKNYKRAEFELLEALELVQTHKVYFTFKRNSLFEYCRKDLELTEDVAMMFIGVMKKSKEIPALRLAIRDQKVCISNARKIAPILTKENHEFWIKEAGSSSKNLKEKLAEEFPERIKKETVKVVTEDLVSITIRVKKSDFEKIKRAKEIQSKKARRVVTFEETLIVSANVYVEKNDPVQKAERVLAKKISASKKAMPSKTQSLEIKEKIQIQPVTIQGGAIPALQLHFVHQRDQGKCQELQADGSKCLSTFFTETHHIKPRSLGGNHEASNLITLCHGHHKAQHYNENYEFI